jgi:hypothetical protein
MSVGRVCCRLLLLILCGLMGTTFAWGGEAVRLKGSGAIGRSILPPATPP